MKAGLHRILDGAAGGSPLVLGPSLGTSSAVWEPQLAGLARRHRVLRWDLPGHGGSPAALLPDDGNASVGALAAHVLRLADAHGWDRFAYAGISLGGAVGLELAVRHPERLTSLALVCSSARFGGGDGWRERAARVRAHGTASLARQTATRWFSAGGRPSAGLRDRLLADLRAVDPDGYAACCEALAGYDLRAELREVSTPTQVIGGLDDSATPPAHARELADGIPGAGLTEIPHAAHLAGVDQPDPVAAALHAHLDGHRAGPSARPPAPAPESTGRT